MFGKITEEGVFLEQLETNPSKYMPEVQEKDLTTEVVQVSILLITSLYWQSHRTTIEFNKDLIIELNYKPYAKLNSYVNFILPLKNNGIMPFLYYLIQTAIDL